MMFIPYFICQDTDKCLLDIELHILHFKYIFDTEIQTILITNRVEISCSMLQVMPPKHLT